MEVLYVIYFAIAFAEGIAYWIRCLRRLEESGHSSVILLVLSPIIIFRGIAWPVFRLLKVLIAIVRLL